MTNKKRDAIILIILILVFIMLNYSWVESNIILKFNENTDSEIGFVKRVVDGDTIEIENNTKIRMLGINTPEKGERYYAEAKKFLEDLILNKTIELEKTEEDTDMYERKLRYVFLDEQNVNLELVKNGFANFYFPSGKEEYYDLFYAAWEECITENKNLCEKSKDKCADCIELREFDDEEEIIILYNKCSFDCNLNKWTIKDEGRKKFSFEKFILEKGKSVTIKVGEGTNTKTNLFWKKQDYVWTETGDTMFLRDNEGKLVIWESY